MRGIRMLEAAQVDVMIVGRGGGSIEDLWAFNEEEVARAIFDCQIPIISAVGHETDTTIADYAADLRAPTPSAAAELAVYDYRQTQMRMQEYGLSLNRLLTQKVTMNRLRLKECQTKLKYLHPRYKLQVHRQRLDDLEDRLRKQMERRLTDSRHRLALYMEAMKGLSPIQKLNQGYSYVEGRDKTVIKSIKQVQPGDSLYVYVTDGVIHGTVTDRQKEER